MSKPLWEALQRVRMELPLIHPQDLLFLLARNGQPRVQDISEFLMYYYPSHGLSSQLDNLVNWFNEQGFLRLQDAELMLDYPKVPMMKTLSFSRKVIDKVCVLFNNLLRLFNELSRFPLTRLQTMDFNQFQAQCRQCTVHQCLQLFQFIAKGFPTITVPKAFRFVDSQDCASSLTGQETTLAFLARHGQNLCKLIEQVQKPSLNSRKIDLLKKKILGKGVRRGWGNQSHNLQPCVMKTWTVIQISGQDLFRRLSGYQVLQLPKRQLALACKKVGIDSRVAEVLWKWSAENGAMSVFKLITDQHCGKVQRPAF